MQQDKLEAFSLLTQFSEECNHFWLTLQLWKCTGQSLWERKGKLALGSRSTLSCQRWARAAQTFLLALHICLTLTWRDQFQIWQHTAFSGASPASGLSSCSASHPGHDSQKFSWDPTTSLLRPGCVSWVLCWKLPKECKAWMQFILKWLGMPLAWSGWESCSWRTAWFYKTLNTKRFSCLTAPEKCAVLWILSGPCSKADWEWRSVELRIFLGFSWVCSLILCSFVFTGQFPQTFFPAPITAQDWTRGLSDLLWFLEAGMLALTSVGWGWGTDPSSMCHKDLWGQGNAA